MKNYFYDRKGKIMTKEKKETKKECDKHHFFVTGTMSRGGHETATHVRCAHCLKHVSLESLESAEWREREGV